MKILIIDALAANEGYRRFSRDAIGVGSRLLAGIIEKHHVSVKISRVEDFLFEKQENIKTYDSFFISAMTVDLIAVEKAIEKIRRMQNNKNVIIGGPIANDIETVQYLNPDLAVQGEGEEIVDCLLESDLKIECFLEKNEKFAVQKFRKRKYVVKLKQISKAEVFTKYKPSTKRIKDYPEYLSAKVYVEIVRGCSNHFRGDFVKKKGNCINCGNCDSPDTVMESKCPVDIPPGCGFCSVPAVFGPPRSKPLELVKEEVKKLFELGVKRIILSAPGFLDYMRGNAHDLVSPTQPPANAEKIEELLATLTKIRDAQSSPCAISVENVKPSLVTEEIAKIMGKYLPNTAISIGCETFNAKHSKEIGRPSSPEQVLNAAKLFSKYGIKPQIYLIHSMPGETVQALNETIYTVKHKLWEIAEKITVYKYQSLPKSPFTTIGAELPVKRHLLIKKREELKEEIRKFNFEKKKAMIGQKILAIVSEKDWTDTQYLIAHPLYGGPVIKLKTDRDLMNKIVEVEITRAINDRIVMGKIVKF